MILLRAGGHVGAIDGARYTGFMWPSAIRGAFHRKHEPFYLYDLQNGFFIPNDRKKYSVGDNAGMKLNKDGGIEIYVAAKKPDGVPEENWLPVNRKDEDLSINLRIYVPDEQRMKTWKAPRAERITH